MSTSHELGKFVGAAVVNPTVRMISSRLASRISSRSSTERSEVEITAVSLSVTEQIDVEGGYGPRDLHAAVEKGDLNTTIKLLSSGVDVDVADNNGETPLMKAAAGNSVVLVKALLIFDALTDKKSSSGHNAFHFSATSSNRKEINNCLNIVSGITKLLKNKINPLEEFGQKQALKAQLERKEKGVFALSLDGGGIRGLVLIQLLKEIERQLGHSIMEHFDWIAGTSTGAILALALSQGKSLTHCRNLYFRLKNEVFTGGRPYSAAPLERLLQEELGVTTTMEQIVHGNKRVMVTTCQGNIAPPKLNIIRSYQLSPIVGFGASKTKQPFEPSKTPAWMAARCSSAAPTYFPAVENTWIDGGLIANNPSNELLRDIHIYNTACQMDPTSSHKPACLTCLLSLGTGKSPPIEAESIDLLIPKTIQDLHRIFNTIDYIGHMKSVLLEQVTCADGAPVDRARSWCHDLSVPFFRFSPQLPEEIDLAETSNEKLIEMLWETKVYMLKERHTIKQLVSLLKLKV